jgi:tetratricopeptide (TPR) repeat protein
LGDRPGISRSLSDLGNLALLQEKQTEAEEYFQQSLANAEQIGNRIQVAKALWGLSWVAQIRGDYAEAKRLLQESKVLYPTYFCDLKLGWAAFGAGECQAAERYFYGVLKLATEAHSVRAVLNSLTGIAHLLAQAGEQKRALELLVLILGHPASDQFHKGKSARLQAELTVALPQDVVAAAQERGRARDLDATVAELLAE